MTRFTVPPLQLESPEIILQRFVESLNYDLYNCARVFLDPEVALSLGIKSPDNLCLFGTLSGRVFTPQLGCVEWNCKGFDCPDEGYICPLTHRNFAREELALEVIFICHCQGTNEEGDRHWEMDRSEKENLVAVSQFPSSHLEASILDRWQRSHWYGQSFDYPDYRS